MHFRCIYNAHRAPGARSAPLQIDFPLFSGVESRFRRFPLSCRSTLAGSHPKVPGGAISGAGVQVAARGGDRGVAEGLLHKVDRRSSVKAVARMGIAEPKGAPGFTLEISSYRR